MRPLCALCIHTDHQAHREKKKGVSLIIYERLFTAHQIDPWLDMGGLLYYREQYNKKDCYKTING